MKRLYFLTAFLIAFVALNAQTVIYNETFETLPLSVTSSGVPGWNRSSALANTGTYSDSSRVAQADTSYLTTASFSTLGNTYVILEFAQICKIEFFDAAEIEVSINNGSTWTKLTGTHYLGSGQFGTAGDKFTAAAYSIWEPSNAATVPQNTWWKTETFNISSLAANQANVKVRFKLSDGNNTGHAGNYGWLIDDIKVTVQPYLNNLVLKKIISPEGDECYNGNETVSIIVGNVGTDPVNTPFTASYKLGNAAPVNETVNTTIAPGDSITYNFTTPINFVLQGADSTLYLKTYVNMAADPFLTNDTLGKDVKFLYTPPAPLADHDTIIYGNTATLGAISTNNIKWYATPTSPTVLDTGATFTTPVLYGNKAYYASAQSGSGGGFMFTEICHYKAAPGVPTAGWPAYLIADDYVEITGPPGGNLSGYILEIWTGTALEGAQTLGNGTILSPNGTCIIATGQLSTSTPSPSNFYYHSGHTLTQSSTTAKGYILKKPGGEIVDAVIFGNLTFPVSSGVTTAHWTGTTPAVSGSGNRLNGPYTKSSANWASATASVPQNPNTPNTGVVIPSTGCESSRTEVWAIVTGNPSVDAGVVSIDQPISPTNLQTQNVFVTIQNFGTSPLTSVTINWENNGITQLAHTWNGNLASNQTASVDIGSFTPILGNNNIVAWVSNPNGVSDPMPLNDTASKIINAFDPLNGIYTIGGTNPNFNDFATAQYALANYGVSGPVTFKVRSGTYNEKLLLPAYNGASATNTVKIIPDAGATVILSVSDTFVVRINNAMYYTIDGSNNGTNSRDFSIINNATNTNTAAIWISGTSDYITLKNLNIAAGSNTVTSTFGIHAGGTSISTSATGNNNNLTIQNNLITKAYFGIYARAASTAKNNNLIIKNNIIGSNTASEYVLYRGVDIAGANAPLVEANEVFNQRVSTSVNVSGVEIGTDVTDAKIKKNRIYGQRSTSTSGYGAYGINIASGTGTSGVEISNNFISDIVTSNYSLTSTLWNPFGIRITGGTGHKIWHNSINMYGAPTTGTAASMSAAIMITVNTATGLDIRNNILSNTMTGLAGSKAYTIYAVTGTTFGQINYNDYYVGGTYGVFAYGGADITTLTAWKTFTSQDVNSINTNPNFVAPNNLYTFSTQLNNVGTPIASVTDDIDGNPRHPSTPDIGATEFSPINLDMGVVEVVSPLNKCAISAATTMSVKVKNYGFSTVNTFNISYSINGGTTVTETFNGSLATDSLHTYTFATTADLSQNIIYNIKYKVTLTGDQFLLNDSMLIALQPKHDFYASEYTMGFETTENYSAWTVIDVNNDSRKWEPGYNSTTYAHTGSQSARFYNGTTNPGNDWLITDCFDFIAGNTYEIKFWYRVENATYPQKVTLMLGNAPIPVAFTDTLVNLNMITNTTYQSASAYVSVPTTGNYYFGWHATSPAANYYTFIDDINIKLIPSQEASLIAMPLPSEGCDLGMDTVGIKIVNTGGSIINGNFTASYQVVGNPSVVTENVTASINVLDTLLFKFNTLVDLSTTVDSTFKINAWINLLNDPFTYNDSISKDIESSITPNLPVGTPDTINYGQQAELIASSNANILWYTSPTSQTPIHTGDTLITPPLFTTTNFYAEASNNTLQYVGMQSSVNGTSGSGLSTYGLYFDALTNFTLKSVVVYPNASANNTAGDVTISVINTAGNVLHQAVVNVMGMVQSTNLTPQEVELNFNIQAASQLRLVMTAKSSGISGLLFHPSSQPAPPYPYTIPGVVSITSGTYSSTLHPELYYYFYNWKVGAPGCFSSRIPVEAYVNLPQYEAGVTAITAPINESCTDNTEAVSILISNSGSMAITSNLTASYKINNGTPVTETVSTTIPSGDTIPFTFTTPININLTSGDTILNIVAYLNHPNDPYQANDTTQTAVTLSYTPPSPIADHDTVPYGTSATVGAISGFDLSWYATPSSTTVLDTGATYTTPLLYGNTPYYVAASEGTGTAFVGAYDLSIGTSSSYANTTYYMIFDVLNPAGVNIASIDIFPSVAAGAAYEIRLLDNTGAMLQSYSGVTTVATGQRETAPVDFDVPFGSNYRIIFGVSPGMWRNTTGANYPYTIPGQISITGNSFTGYPEYYYFFYNWQVGSGSGCQSPRTEVWAIVTGNPAVDAGVISVDLPLSPTNLQSQDAYVTIQNFGSSPLTSVTVNWMNNGVLQLPFTWNGNLSTSQTAQVNLGAFTPVLGNNNLVAWTSNPNGVTDPMLLNDTASALIEAFEPLCGLLTIGGTNANFPTFADAIYALENYGVGCPVTFKVNPGTYPERIVLEAYTGVSATNTITFEGQPGAIINYEPTTTNDRAVILLNGAQYIKLDSLIINIPATATYGYGIHMTNVCSDIQITNCTINTIATASSTNYAGIVASGSITSATTTGNSVNNLLVENNTIRGGYYGTIIYGASATTLSNIKIYNNTIEDAYYYGIYMYYNNMPDVIGNNIRMRNAGTITTSNYGMYVNYVTGPFKVTKNNIINAGLYGIYVSSSNASTNKSIIANNMIGGGFQNLTSASTSGIYITSSANIGLYYNSINMNADLGNALYALSSATQMDIRNNSFAYTGGSTGYAVNIATPANQTQMNNNNYFSNGSKFVKYGSDYANLAALKAVNIPVGNDTASKEGNPNYYSNSNLHALTTQLYQGGQTIAGITDDFDGDIRNVLTPCIGADEYVPANIDAGPIALYAPESTCGLSNAEQISVIVYNSGLNAFNNISISYSVNGSTPVSQTFNQSVPSSTVDTFTFTTPFDFSAHGIFNVHITTNLTGDQLSFNDTMTFVINTGHDIAASAYTMGFELNEDVSNWTVLDVNANNYTWQPQYSSTTFSHTGSYSARFYNTSANTGGDWLFTPCFSLEGGKSYKIEFYYRAESTSYPQNVALLFGTDNTPAAMQDTLLDLNSFTNTTHQLASSIVNVTTTGVYYFAWLAYSPGSIYYSYIDDINIRLLEQRDAAVIAINNLDPIVNGSAAFIPEVKIQNLGSDTLTNIPVKYTVNGGTPVTETWIGTLLPDSTVDYTFTTGFTIPSGNFTMCAYTQLSNDGNNANDTTCQDAFGIPLIVPPFNDDFEGAMNLYTVGATNQWQLGIPSASVINSAHSPVNVWATNLAGNYDNNSNYNLLTPRFNFMNVDNAVIGFWHWYDTESGNDGGRLQYTTNNGQTWQTLGVVSDPLGTNWYNTASINGAPAFSGTSGGWVYSEFDLTQFNNYAAPIQFRFNFFANNSVNNFNGWAIDDFVIYQAQIPTDAGVTAIINPSGQVVTGSVQNVEVTIKNLGTGPLTTIPVRYRVNNGVPVQEQWTGNLQAGDSVNYVFNMPITQTASYNLCAWTRVSGDTYTNNDTSCTSITVIPAQYDAAVLEITTPGTQTTIGQQVSISAKIKNFGTEPLTSIDIAYDLNAGSQTVETWTGNLAPNAEIIYDFTNTYMSLSGNYVLCVETQLVNDQNATNDKVCKTILGTVGIGDDYNSDNFSLGQNIPNPAQLYTTINFNIPKEGKVVFKLTNTLGQTVYEENISRASGYHEIVLQTAEMAKGIYHYSVEFEGQRLVKKLVIN
ncbi:MAG: right-handed parallel beta-helix repeat-containing protein [Bacteroidales bacterium]|nr:right-handed parallel beta-helix repeat-containing protein [Bacteroidales bacterium]